MKRLALLVLSLAACNKGTYVVLDFTKGPTQAATSIECSLTLGGQTASTTFEKKGATLTFPLRGALLIEHGAGTLDVTCNAMNAGAVVAQTSGTVDVVHDASETVELSFAPTLPDIGMDLDEGVDGGGDAGDAFVPRTGLTMSPKTHDFGTLVVGSKSAAFTFTVTNAGNEPTAALTASISGAGFAKDPSSTCDGATLSPNQTCIVAVTFSPVGASTVSGALAVTFSGLDPGSAANASLAGTGANAGNLMWSDSAFDFGSTQVSSVGNMKTFTLTNNGGSTTSTITTSVTGTDSTAFVLSNDTCNNQTLAAGKTCTVTATFDPDVRGNVAVSLQAVATTGGTAVVALTGKALGPAVLSLSGGSTMTSPFNFGTVELGSSATVQESLTLTNTGDVATSVVTITLSATSPAVVGEISRDATSTCVSGTTTLASGASCTYVVDFAPTKIGLAKQYSVTFAASTGGTVDSFMTGTGYDTVTVAVGHIMGTNAGDGTVTSSDGNFNCGPTTTMCEFTYQRTGALNLTFTATANTTSSFDSWSYVQSPPACAGGTGDATCVVALGSVAANLSSMPYEYDATFDM